MVSTVICKEKRQSSPYLVLMSPGMTSSADQAWFVWPRDDAISGAVLLSYLPEQNGLSCVYIDARYFEIEPSAAVSFLSQPR